MSNKIKVIIGVLIVGSLIALGVFYFSEFRGASPAFNSPAGDISEMIKNGDNPLDVPQGFDISVFADDLEDPRVLVQDGLGNFWVSQPDLGEVILLDVGDNGEVVSKTSVFEDLNRPHGLAVDYANDGLTLYIAEEDKISRVDLYTEDSLEKVVDLPEGGRHWTRTIEFGPDGRLYVSIGSTCDVCFEKDDRYASIYSMKRDGSDFRKVAEGLRNSVFFTWSYIDGSMWATEMGRDHLGDDLPPDEINIIQEGGNYGWPICYGDKIHDDKFDNRQYVRDPCEDTVGSYIDIQAHSAPLGLAFVPEEGWPEEYWYDLFVAYHGSWNRSEPTGYKIKRFKLDDRGSLKGRDDFVSGWLKDDSSSFGRPVDLLIQPGGILYITDDKAGVIYKLTYKGDES